MAKRRKGDVPRISGRAVLLIGKAEARFLVPSQKDQVEKHLYSYGTELYMYWPYQGSRCIVTYNGRYVCDHDLIVYGRDCIHPHIEMTWPEVTRRRIGNTRSRFEETIKEERAGNYKNPKKMAGSLLNNDFLKKNWPMLLVAGVLVIAFLKSQGGF